MTGVPGLRNPIARLLFNAALGVENFARWWNREPLIPPGGFVRRLPPEVEGKAGSFRAPGFDRINHRDDVMGFVPGARFPRDAERGELVVVKLGQPGKEGAR